VTVNPPPSADARQHIGGNHVKLTRTTIVVPLAALLLVGAAGAVLATGGSPAAPGAVAPAAASPTPSAPSGTTMRPAFKDSLLSDVLDDLVAKGTITAEQRTAITDALDAARTARHEEAQARMEQLRTFLSDGVITQEEFDQLPEDSRLRQLTTLMDDGQITSDELRGLFGGRGGGGGRGFGGGHGFGGGPFGLDDDAAPSASPTTGS